MSPHEGVGFINEVVGPMMITRDDVELVVENGIETRLAEKGVKVAGKPEPRRCETIEETDVGGTADGMLGASLKHQGTRVSREETGVETPEGERRPWLRLSLKLMTNINKVKKMEVSREDVNGVTKEPSRKGFGIKLGLEELQMVMKLIRGDVAKIGST